MAWPLPDDSMPMPLADDSAPAPLDLLPPADADPTIGHVGRYALKHRVGAGGLGNVYTAWDPILSRNLAIKTLHVSGVHRDTLDALILDEARAIARLNHPHIVTVFDAGLSERGVYIAMEQLPGCDLRQLLDEDWRPDALRAAKLARRVGEALAYSHHHGVIHCDIKPANIFMVDRRKPKVLDFGIARVAQRPQVRGMEGLVTGSPHYLAPEQLRNGPVDVRTDVYALGVVMYELLTGMKAFPGTRLEQITDSVLRGQAVPAHERVPGVSPELSAICAKAMALAPSQRYASAKEFVYALREWQVRHSSPARPSANAAAAAARPAATRQVPTRPVFPTSEADE
ncbi:MAG: serine/threonine protein kinase, partial [Burkholderiales bacterium]|nr:serine/threonine protein kinase [Burkholderiales bacterium]